MPTSFDNLQPAVAVTEAILTAGIFPSATFGGSPASIAAIRHFAFFFAPGGTAATHGQLLPLSQNTALFSLLGTTYGGNGTNNFALPDLDTILSVGSGQGPGLTDRYQGGLFGVDDLFLIRANMLASLGGNSTPFDNTAPSLPVLYLINAEGTYNGGQLIDIGMVWEFAGGFVPAGTLECNGQLLAISEYETLFNLIGTTYGGDGQETFAVPDLRGRAIVGSSNAGGDLGTLLGTETQTIGAVNLPAEMGGGAQPLDNHGPSLVLRYMIAIEGVFPSQTGSGLDDMTPVLGEIVATAGNMIPNGWAECRGQLLPINQNQALFALLGTTYGGDGRVNFALPDLRGRALVGADASTPVGTIVGDDYIVLTLDNIPDLYVTGSDAIDDTLFGGNDADFLFGLAGNDTLIGYLGGDYLDGGTGDDTLRGGGGNDVYVVDSTLDVVEENASEGTDEIRTGLEIYSLGALPNVENLTGEGDVDQALTGNDGNNRIDGGLGADLMAGGLGDDTYVVDNAGDVPSESPGEGTDTVLSSVTFTLGPDFENLTLTGSAAIDGTGNDLDNILIGNGAANILSGGIGMDTIDGGLGADLMVGGLGDDTYVVDNAGDVASESAGEGTDSVLSSIIFTLGAEVENLTLTGTALYGTGNGLANILIGNAMNNVLNGGAGNDTLNGNNGNDTLIGAAGDDALNGGIGIDLAYYAAATGAVSVNLGLATAQDTLGAGIDTLTSVENLTGSAFADTLVGNGVANTLNGGVGYDVLRGGYGSDNLIGGEGNDTLDGGNGSDLLTGGNGIDVAFYSGSSAAVTVDLGIATAQNTLGAGSDTLSAVENLIGSSFGDTLIGNAGANSINGWLGNDLLAGGGGNDTLIGGAGADNFRFDTALNATTNVDLLSDFAVADDTVLLSAAVFTAIGAGTLDAAAFQLGTAADDAGDRIIYDSATGRIYYDADGDGAGAQTLFARVAVGTVLTNANFVAQAPAAEAPKTADEPLPSGLDLWRAGLIAGDAFALTPSGDARPYQPGDYFFV